ncbi:MAG: methyltransferase, partial [Alphaproteobacteria bacterium]
MNKIDTKEDSWLGQKLVLRQPIRSYRVAIDAALLAAAIPLKPGKNALELGTGVGAVALALALRVQDCRVTAV